jgi:hypothetical protein
MTTNPVSQFISIGNNGQDIASTNYWSSEQALAGLCFASTNAGAIRLLVPKATEFALSEMRTGKKITIERSLSHDKRCVDIVFEDGTDSPFFLTISKKQFDLLPGPQVRKPFSVWTENGKQLEFLAKVKKF